MTQAAFEPLKTHFARIKASGEWDEAAQLLYNYLWVLAEKRPDFESLPDWILREEGLCAALDTENRLDQACVACRNVLRDVVETYCTNDEQGNFRACESFFFHPGEWVELDRSAEFVVSAADLIVTFNYSTQSLPLTFEGDWLRIGRHTRISFNRTVRIPEDGKAYPLPAGLGRLPVLRVEDYLTRVPDKWRKEGGFIIPLYQREALFLEFQGAEWRPSIAKVGVGGVNAITGKDFDVKLRAHRQDYVVIPEQKWLDGINSENGRVRQFVAMPLGQGYTVEAQITDEEILGGFQIIVYNPKDGIFSNRSPEELLTISEAELSEDLTAGALFSQSDCTEPSVAGAAPKGFQLQARPNRPQIEEMGIAAGGTIIQSIIEDFHGVDSWDEESFRKVPIHIVNSEVYSHITGEPLPPSPISIEHYQKLGIPWYQQYEENMPKLKPAGVFKRILSIAQIDKKRNAAPQRDVIPSVAITEELIRKIHTPTKSERIRTLLVRAKQSLDANQPRIAIRESSLCHDISGGTCLDALRIRAQAYWKLRCFKDAEMDSSLILEKSPDDLFARSIRGWSLFHLDDLHSALRDAEAGLLARPGNNLFLTLRARIHFADWELEAALADAEQVLQADPENKILRDIQKIARTELGL